MAVDYTNLQKMAQQYQPQQPQSPYQPRPQKPKSGIGCVLIIVLLAFLIGMGSLVFFWVYPTYFSKDETTVVDKKTGKEKKVSKKSSLEGTLSYAIIAPDDEGKNNLWIITYKYKNSKYIVNTYIYDPEENKILKNYETESSVFPSLSKLYYINKEVWKLNSSSSGVEAGIFIYDPATGEEKYNTRSFSEKYPELQGGISNLYFYEKQCNINFETKDGRKPVLDVETGKMYQSSTEYNKSFKDEKEEMSIFSLGVVKSGEEARKKLFLVTGPKSSLRYRDISESYFSDPSTLKFFTKSTAKPLLEDKVFLEGEMLYQDDECCFVFHQSQAGNEAERLLSCIDKKGTVLWTVSTEDVLFSKLRATSKDPTSGMFFMKHNVHVQREGNMVLFSFDRFGLIGFDFETGKKIYESELSK
jgi:hypothetical protein